MDSKQIRPISYEEKSEFLECVILAASCRGELTEHNTEGVGEAFKKNGEKINLILDTMPFRDLESVERDLLKMLSINSPKINSADPKNNGLSDQHSMNRAERRRMKRKQVKNFNIGRSKNKVALGVDLIEEEKANIGFNLPDTHPELSNRLADLFNKVLNETAREEDWDELVKLNHEIEQTVKCRLNN